PRSRSATGYGRPPTSGSAIAEPAAARSFGSDRRHDRHAWPKQHVGRLVEHDLHRHALHDLDKIAGGVFRGQQAEGGAAASLNAVDMAFEYAMRVGVDADVNRIARPHRQKLRLLEICRDPD